jgi:hypothetical protein
MDALMEMVFATGVTSFLGPRASFGTGSTCQTQFALHVFQQDGLAVLARTRLSEKAVLKVVDVLKDGFTHQRRLRQARFLGHLLKSGLNGLRQADGKHEWSFEVTGRQA